jgi:hypothetical protein
MIGEPFMNPNIIGLLEELPFMSTRPSIELAQITGNTPLGRCPISCSTSNALGSTKTNIANFSLENYSRAEWLTL